MVKVTGSVIRNDVQSGLVVFLVALPLCLGIAVASGASPFAGVISGVIGGIVVGMMSGSHVSVTGPAAGLIAIILTAITQLGFEAFLVALVIAGVLQLLLGVVKAGTISSYFPNSVIEGMLAAIGIIIIKKEVPHAFGYDKMHEGDFFNLELGAENFFTEWVHAINFAHPGAILVTLISLAILISFQKVSFLKKIKAVPGALIAVVVGILINEGFRLAGSDWLITGEHLVMLPTASNFSEFIGQFQFPDWSVIADQRVWVVGLTIAIVASIESLLCLEAGDRMDPMKRYSSANRELLAQGTGNLLSGLIGGLPMTSVIVRTTANVNAGAKTKLSSIVHGILLLLAVVLIPGVLNMIPMASLAAILLMIGFKLANPSVFKHMWALGKHQFTPFVVTVIAVVLTDLLKGVAVGIVVSVFYILRGNMKLAYFFRKEKHQAGDVIHIDLAQEVSFLNKAAIKQTLAHLPAKSKVIINAAQTVYIDQDVLTLLRDFVEFGSKDRLIDVSLVNFKPVYQMTGFTHVSSQPADPK